MLNLDPNMNFSGNTAVKTIRLVFGAWDYRAVRNVTVGGNCSGLTNIEAAIESLFDDLYDERPSLPQLVMERENGEKLICEDDENREEDWLKDMLVSAEIVAATPTTK